MFCYIHLLVKRILTGNSILFPPLLIMSCVIIMIHPPTRQRKLCLFFCHIIEKKRDALCGYAIQKANAEVRTKIERLGNAKY